MNEHPPVRHLLLPAAVAALFATICDAVHIYTGTLTYLQPERFNNPWTVFPSFFAVFVIMMLVYDRVFTMLPSFLSRERSLSKGSLAACVESFSIFVLVYLMSGVGSDFPLALNIIFYSTFFVRWLVTYDRMFILLFAVVLGVGGVVGEGLLAVAGIVEYAYADIFHMPWWLGGVYMHGALALREVMRFAVYGRFGDKAA